MGCGLRKQSEDFSAGWSLPVPAVPFGKVDYQGHDVLEFFFFFFNGFYLIPFTYLRVLKVTSFVFI